MTVAVVMCVASAVSFAVSVGDLALISFAADDPDSISFVVLREIPAGTALRFTDSGWTLAGTFRANEGGVQYTAPANLPPGTVVTGVSSFTTGGWSVNNDGLGAASLLLSTSGDQVLAFIGPASAPQFLHAIHFDSTGFGNATNATTTALPAGLTAGSTAVHLGEFDNGYYNGPTVGTAEELLAAIATPANWVRSDNPLTLPAWSFEVQGGTPSVTAVTLPGTAFDVGEVVTVTVVLSGAPAEGSPATVQLTGGALAGPEELIIEHPADSGTIGIELAVEGFWTLTATGVSGATGEAVSPSFTVGAPLLPPTAYAGLDRTVELQGSAVEVFLADAAADDPNGLDGATYAWTPVSTSGLAGWQSRTGPIVESTDPGKARVTFSALGEYVLTLTVTDADGLLDADTVAISVVEPPIDGEDEYSPPPGYYAGAVGQGAALKAQLSQIMAAGHVPQTYGAYKHTAARYDADPNDPGRILLVYNRASVPGAWDGGATWNREHIWPQSLQPGNANESTTGNLGDPYSLRPCDPGINSTRGNKPYGSFATIGGHRSLGTFYFPGDFDKGDVARALFYSATRYMSDLSLVNGDPSGYSMGDLASLLRWHYTDAPDTFERRRGHLIFLDQHNRNAYIDHPEFVWSIFGDGANDSTLHLSEDRPADGASAVAVELGPVIVGGPLPSPSAVTLHKSGSDPTYFAVTTSGDATSSVTGRFNAFDYGSQQRSITVGLVAATAAAGVVSGTVTIDNLDISSEGAGEGSADGNDVIELSLPIYDHAEASFSAGADDDTLLIDLGTAAVNSGVRMASFDVFNLPAESGLTANLDLLGFNSTGDDDVLTTDAEAVFGLPAGAGVTFQVAFDPANLAPGVYTAVYTINVADEDLPGGVVGNPLTLTLTATVAASLPYDADGDGDVDAADWAIFADCLLGPAAGYATPSCDALDGDFDGDVDLLDAAGFQAAAAAG